MVSLIPNKSTDHLDWLSFDELKWKFKDTVLCELYNELNICFSNIIIEYDWAKVDSKERLMEGLSESVDFICTAYELIWFNFQDDENLNDVFNFLIFNIGFLVGESCEESEYFLNEIEINGIHTKLHRIFWDKINNESDILEPTSDLLIHNEFDRDFESFPSIVEGWMKRYIRSAEEVVPWYKVTLNLLAENKKSLFAIKKLLENKSIHNIEIEEKIALINTLTEDTTLRLFLWDLIKYPNDVVSWSTGYDQKWLLNALLNVLWHDDPH